MKKYITFIIAVALVIGLAQCKKQEIPAMPDTPEVEGNWVRITLSVGGGGREMDTLYPSTGAVVYQDGDIIYVGNNGKYRGKLEYQNGTFSGLVCDPEPTDYLHFYYLSELTPSNFWPLYKEKDSLVPNTTEQFTVNIADQSGGLPVISYGHSTTLYTNETSAYTCMLMNKCGLVKFVTRPTPSTTNSTVTISGRKTTAFISFNAVNPGITPTDDTGPVTLYKYDYNGSDPAVRWAILLPQDATNATVSYKSQDNDDITQTISMPEIKANTFYGGYNGITVGLEWVDLGLDKGTLWATCNVGSDSPEGFGTFFAWAETEPKSTYCWHSYKYAYNPRFYPDNPPADTITAEGSGYSSDDTLHHERSGGENKPNLGFFRYNTDEDYCRSDVGNPDDNITIYDRAYGTPNFLAQDDAAYVNWGKDWRIPTAEEWGDLLNETTQSWDVVNGVGGVRFTGKIQSWGDYTNKSIFLPAAGVYGGPMHSFYFGCGNLPHGEYWSNEIDSNYPYRAYILFFDDPSFSGGGGSMDHLGVKAEAWYSINPNDPPSHVEFIRNQGRPVRAVRTEENRK